MSHFYDNRYMCSSHMRHTNTHTLVVIEIYASVYDEMESRESGAEAAL